MYLSYSSKNGRMQGPQSLMLITWLHLTSLTIGILLGYYFNILDSLASLVDERRRLAAWQQQVPKLQPRRVNFLQSRQRVQGVEYKAKR
jgi:hypothetical protein